MLIILLALAVHLVAADASGGDAANILPPITARPQPQQTTISNGSIPDYVVKYAPLVWLHSEEKYFPGDVYEYCQHFDIFDKNDKSTKYNGNIADLGKYHGDEFTMVATEDWTESSWIYGNKPEKEGYCEAPATLIVVDKGNGWIDAFWFYFYPFNLGPKVLSRGPIGNHLGDWEYTMVRFYDGRPRVTWLSCHESGLWWLYHDLQRQDSRAVVYSAVGTHANYASAGTQQRDPTGSLVDITDKGTLWDPAANYLAYTFDGEAFYGVSERESAYGSWLTFSGRWGNRRLPRWDRRQRRYGPKLWRYVDGPQGPLMKGLIRVSPSHDDYPRWWKFWHI